MTAAAPEHWCFWFLWKSSLWQLLFNVIIYLFSMVGGFLKKKTTNFFSSDFVSKNLDTLWALLGYFAVWFIHTANLDQGLKNGVNYKPLEISDGDLLLFPLPDFKVMQTCEDEWKQCWDSPGSQAGAVSPGHTDLHSPLLEPPGIPGFSAEGQKSTCLAQPANGPKRAVMCTHSWRNSEES